MQTYYIQIYSGIGDSLKILVDSNLKSTTSPQLHPHKNQIAVRL